MKRRFDTHPYRAFVLISGLVGVVVMFGLMRLASRLIGVFSKVSFIIGYSPDADELYYCADDSVRHVRALNVKTGRSRTMADVPVEIVPNERIPKTGKWLVASYESRRGQLGIYSDQFTHRITEFKSEFSDAHASIQKNKQIVFVRAVRPYVGGFGGESWTDCDVCVMNADGAGLKQITTLRTHRLSTPSLSADGSKAVLDERGTHENNQVIEVDLHSGHVRALSPANVTSSHPTYSSDGKRITFTSDRLEKYQYEVYMMNADGSSARQVTKLKRRCMNPVFAANDRTIFFIVDESELWQVHDDGSECRRVD
jgi:Tol biopolymer transport system component